MSTASFYKTYKISDPDDIKTFYDELDNPKPKREIKRNIVSEEDRKRGAEKLRQILSR